MGCVHINRAVDLHRQPETMFTIREVDPNIELLEEADERLLVPFMDGFL